MKVIPCCLCVAAALAGSACSTTDQVFFDAGVVEDAGTSMDAGPLLDAGPPDAGPMDLDGGPDAGPRQGPEIGSGDHSATSVRLTQIASHTDGLARPRALAFNTRIPNELWVVNDYPDEGALIIQNAAGALPPIYIYRRDSDAAHFMPHPAAIAFGADATTFGIPGTFSTCGESRNDYDNTSPPNDFMGPVLWSSDLSVFAAVNQDPGTLGSHIDMLHVSPLCMGIAHEEANIYWTFGGLSGYFSAFAQPGAIYKYDFHQDHGPGNNDHSDGTAYEYLSGQVKYLAGVPSHLAYDPASKMLYIADTGDARILQLDTTSGQKGEDLMFAAPELMQDYAMWDNAIAVEVVPASSNLLQAPSGILLKDGLLYVSDNTSSKILAFNLQGEQVNYLDTGLPTGSLAGMAFGPDGKLYLVDMIGNRVLRIDPCLGSPTCT
jgi:hypothetical protein